MLLFGQNSRFQIALGKGLALEDTLWATPGGQLYKTPMGVGRRDQRNNTVSRKDYSDA
jgi:hypothetical protein